MQRFLCESLKRFGTGAAVVLISAAAFGGWELTRPLTDFFPPPVAVEPGMFSPRTVAPTNGGPSLEEQILILVNQERWNNGELPPLKGNILLDSSSETHSANMGSRDFFSHCDLDTGTTPWDRIVAAGYFYNWAAENIAAGNSTAEATMAQWMGSSGHRANILSTTFRELGVGYGFDSADSSNVRLDNNRDCVADSFGNGPYFHYWTQNFGRRDTVYPVVIEREAYSTDTRDVALYLYGTGWATEMRLRNENGSWTAWQAFASTVQWQLSAGAGTKEVSAEIRNGGTVRSASDTIHSNDDTVEDEVFSDGFESGDESKWDSTVE
jgi:uncharacterized protein YkwD